MTAGLGCTLGIIAMAVSFWFFNRRRNFILLLFTVTVVLIGVFVTTVVILGNQTAKFVTTVFNSTFKIVAMTMEHGYFRFRFRTIAFVCFAMSVSAIAIFRENIP